jgi:hypothetical protein
MPTPLVKKYAKKYNVSVSKVEKIWNESKEIARKKLKLPDDDNKWKGPHWAYVTGIFKKKVKSLKKETVSTESNVCAEWIK